MGYGGLPNAEGDMEFDAAIMDGELSPLSSFIPLSFPFSSLSALSLAWFRPIIMNIVHGHHSSCEVFATRYALMTPPTGRMCQYGAVLALKGIRRAVSVARSGTLCRSTYACPSSPVLRSDQVRCKLRSVYVHISALLFCFITSTESTESLPSVSVWRARLRKAKPGERKGDWASQAEIYKNF